MKINMGLISNSSGTSFVFYEKEMKDILNNIRDLIKLSEQKQSFKSKYHQYEKKIMDLLNEVYDDSGMNASYIGDDIKINRGAIER